MSKKILPIDLFLSEDTLQSILDSLVKDGVIADKNSPESRIVARNALRSVVHYASSPVSIPKLIHRAERVLKNADNYVIGDVLGLIEEMSQALSERSDSPWLPIEKLSSSDDLFWFLRHDEVTGFIEDGPRTPQADGMDSEEGWEWFAPCVSPASPELPRLNRLPFPPILPTYPFLAGSLIYHSPDGELRTIDPNSATHIRIAPKDVSINQGLMTRLAAASMNPHSISRGNLRALLQDFLVKGTDISELHPHLKEDFDTLRSRIHLIVDRPDAETEMRLKALFKDILHFIES